MTFIYTNAFLTLATDNIHILVGFYSTLLEQKPEPHIPQVYAEFQLQGLRLGIFRPKNVIQPEFTNSMGSRMSLCLEVTDLAVAIARLTDMGYSPPGEIITASHGTEIYAYDPDNNRLILHQSN